MNTEKELSKAPDNVPETEAELEAFRKRWREEVSARNRQSPQASSSTARVNEKSQQRLQAAAVSLNAASASGPSTGQLKNFNEEIAPKAYHDLPDKEEALKLGVEGQDHDRAAVFKEPSSALEHYERAVERETQGNLSESMRHYRRAFKLDDGVHEAYKRKHFPPSFFAKHKPVNSTPANAPVVAPNIIHPSSRSGATSGAIPATVKQLIDDFSDLRIEAKEPETSLSSPEPCHIATLPDELLSQILSEIAIHDVATFTKLAQVCKRLAYLVYTEDAIWKQVCTRSPFGFPSMLYDYTVEIEGEPISANDQIAHYLQADDGEQDPEAVLPPTPEEQAIAFHVLTEHLLHTTYNSSWLSMFRQRPRIRFNGCYISTVNYTRPGANSTNTLTWGAPIHVVTYFRYIRFFRDGTAISLLTTAEPVDVVHHLTKDNLQAHHHHHQHHRNQHHQSQHHQSSLPSSVMKDALRGRWRLTGPHHQHFAEQPQSQPQPETRSPAETEGDVYLETEGAVPKYTYLMHLALAHAGKGTRNNKLAWRSFHSYNKLTDDWGEFGLRNDRAFYWSRVRSYEDL